jgi:hypothetical protein
MGDFIQFLKRNAFDNLNISSHTIDLQGWVNGGFRECLQIIGESLKGKNKVLIFEIGSWKGASCSQICQHMKTQKIDIDSIICIDTWLGAPEFLTWGLNDPNRGTSLLFENGYPRVFYTFTKNMKSLGHHDIVAPFPMSSVQSADVLSYYNIKADVMYIDGSHEYQAVKMDLETFRPLLKPGGIMWGDDYSSNWPGVKKAVDEFALQENLRLTVIGDNWIIKE